MLFSNLFFSTGFYSALVRFKGKKYTGWWKWCQTFNIFLILIRSCFHTDLYWTSEIIDSAITNNDRHFREKWGSWCSDSWSVLVSWPLISMHFSGHDRVVSDCNILDKQPSLFKMGPSLLFGFILHHDPPADKFSLNLLISLLNWLINTYLNSYLTLVTIISLMNDFDYMFRTMFSFLQLRYPGKLAWLLIRKMVSVCSLTLVSRSSCASFAGDQILPCWHKRSITLISLPILSA